MKVILKYLIVLVLLLMSNTVYGQTYTSHNFGGEWTEDSTWINNVPLYIIEGNNVTIQISQNTNVLSLGNLTFAGNNVNLNIEGHLIVDGNVTMLKNNVTFNIFPGGGFIINGDLIFGNNVELIINGNLIIDGDVSGGGGNSSISGGGNINVGGDWNFEGDDDDFSGTLPIELLTFTAHQHQRSIKIEWVTASEINNDYFVLELSTDLQNWNIVTYVQGAGDSNSLLKYSYVDENPYHGISYYRLTQHDFDGKFEVFDPIAVNFSISDNFRVEIYDFMGIKLKEMWVYNIDERLPSFNRPVIVRYFNNQELIQTRKLK